jgi:hypothetical protein
MYVLAKKFREDCISILEKGNTNILLALKLDHTFLNILHPVTNVVTREYIVNSFQPSNAHRLFFFFEIGSLYLALVGLEFAT